MNKGNCMTVNQPLTNTYSWLRANRTELPGIRMDGAPTLTASVPEGVAVRHEAPDAGMKRYAGMRTGMGADMEALLVRSGVVTRVYTAPRNWKGDALRLRYAFRNAEPYEPDHKAGGAAGAMESVCLEAADGSELTAVMDYHSVIGGAGLGAVQTKAVVGKNAVLRLVQIQRLGRAYTLLNNIGVHCGENARFELIRLVLGGQHTYDGCSAALDGDRACFGCEIGYRVGDAARLDMNYEAIHTGRRTQSEIHAAGVLRGEASKIFRGTIDLRKGCSGSAGSETEDVLLMDETVRNRTVPVILCGEEDVTGNHGATIGRLDEALIFYLQSRGMAREEIYELCARARIDAVIRKIPDPETIRRLFPHCAEEETPDIARGGNAARKDMESGVEP